MKTHDPFREMEQLFDQLWRDIGRLGRGPLGQRRHDWYDPETAIAVDVREHPDEFEVTADVPGYEKDDLTVSISDDTLTIRADRESDEDDGNLVRNERRKDTVERVVTLSTPVLADESEATYSNGVLSVILPKETSDEDTTEIEIN